MEKDFRALSAEKGNRGEEEMKFLDEILLFIYLLTMGIYDLKTKEIQLSISVILTILLSIVEIYYVICGEQKWYISVTGIVLGIFLILLSFATRGQIGTGDGIVFIITGIVLGFYRNMILLFMALIFSALAGGVMFVLGKVGRKDTLPFIPFVFAGYGVMCIWELQKWI